MEKEPFLVPRVGFFLVTAPDREDRLPQYNTARQDIFKLHGVAVPTMKKGATAVQQSEARRHASNKK